MDNENDKLFQVSVKGLFLKENKVLMMQQPDGIWEPPGGRIQKGEDLLDCLKRECLEETGLNCEILNTSPLIAYSSIDQKGRARIMLYYKIRFKNLQFKPSDECIEMKFFSQDELKRLKLAPQIQPLHEFLNLLKKESKR